MSYKIVIYKMIEKIKPSCSLFDFYSSLMSFERGGFANFIARCRALVYSIIKEGTAVTVTNSISNRRRSLGLPPLEFDTAEIKKLARVTGLLKILERSE